MVVYFGKRYDAPIYKETNQAPTPDGVECTYCDEPIKLGEDGFIDSSMCPYHRECWIRSILGSVEHQMGVCGCFTGNHETKERSNMTRREAAKLALAYSEGRR